MSKLSDVNISSFSKKLELNQTAPNFLLVNEKFENISLDSFGKKIKIISTFPSINTSVCDIQTRKLNELYNKSDKVVVINVSCDLPFALKTWCGAQGIENAIILSDYQTNKFGKDYGILIDDFNLLYRSIFVLNEDNKIVYKELVNKISDSINFDKLIETINNLIK